VRAATALLENAGPLGVTLRGTARMAGVSQAAPYRHFRHKGALLAAVAEEGFRNLGSAMNRAARRHRADPIRALRAIAVALVRFAAEHPSHYRLMCGPAVRGRDHPPLREAAVAVGRILAETVAESQRVGRVKAGDPVPLAFALWCMVHGLSILLVDEQIPPAVLAQYSAERLAEHATGLLLEGLERTA
jgi:AcrR family transcriptional regulator